MKSNNLQQILTRIFHGTIVLSILSFAIPIAITIIDSKSNLGIFIWLLYANFFILWPAICISLISLISIYIKTYELKRGLEISSLRVLTLLLSILLVYLGVKEMGNRTNKVDVVLRNNSSNIITNIELFGRGALTELDSLEPYADTTIVFRGKSILRNISNNYENEISLRYFTQSKLFREPILEDFDRWRVLGTGIKIEFFRPDSLQIKLLFEDLS